MTSTTHIAAIKEIGRSLDFSISASAAERLHLYAAELCRWNHRVNLTGAKDVAAFINGPLFDTLTVVPVLRPSATLVDVGSGGGLPGIPIAILEPETRITLVEPRARRGAFLRHVTHLLGITAEIIETRDESLPPRRWSSAISQAVWPPEEWVRRAMAILSPGGVVYVLSARDIPEAALGHVEARYHAPHVARGVARFSFRVGASTSSISP